MGASAREIEREIKATRDRMDDNLTRLEGRAASNAARYGRIAAIGVGVIALGAGAVLIYRRMHRPTLKDRLGDISAENLRALLESLSGRLKEELPSVTVRVNEKPEPEPGTLETILRKVAPALVGTASTALMDRISRAPDGTGSRPPQAD